MKKMFFVLSFVVTLLISVPVGAISKTEAKLVSDHCTVIRDNLKTLQKMDARARVYLGSYYEAILSKFITPLNVRLVENNLSNGDLVENQNDFADARALFSSDFMKSQKGLEELVGMNCKDAPEAFYDKLEIVRQKRKIMEQDVLKMREVISRHIRLVNELKGKL